MAEHERVCASVNVAAGKEGLYQNCGFNWQYVSATQGEGILWRMWTSGISGGVCPRAKIQSLHDGKPQKHTVLYTNWFFVICSYT